MMFVGCLIIIMRRLFFSLPFQASAHATATENQKTVQKKKVLVPLLKGTRHHACCRFECRGSLTATEKQLILKPPKTTYKGDCHN
jgi:hypothetical protein